MSSCPTAMCSKGARCGDCMQRDGLARPAECSCDPRFVEVAHDITCRVHGLWPIIERKAA